MAIPGEVEARTVLESIAGDSNDIKAFLDQSLANTKALKVAFDKKKTVLEALAKKAAASGNRNLSAGLKIQQRDRFMDYINRSASGKYGDQAKEGLYYMAGLKKAKKPKVVEAPAEETSDQRLTSL